MQHMVLSLSTRAHGGQLVHSLSENSSCVPTGHTMITFSTTFVMCKQFYGSHK